MARAIEQGQDQSDAPVREPGPSCSAEEQEFASVAGTSGRRPSSRLYDRGLRGRSGSKGRRSGSSVHSPAGNDTGGGGISFLEGRLCLDSETMSSMEVHRGNARNPARGLGDRTSSPQSDVTESPSFTCPSIHPGGSSQREQPRGHQRGHSPTGPTSSPPAIVASASNTSGLTESVRPRTEPSAYTTFVMTTDLGESHPLHERCPLPNWPPALGRGIESDPVPGVVLAELDAEGVHGRTDELMGPRVTSTSVTRTRPDTGNWT